MPLILNLTCRDPALLPGGIRRVEVHLRLSVGRGADNDLSLADPERQLSKNHCVIQFDGRAYTLTDTSTNGVFLNDSPERLMRDVPVALVEGCVLRLGAYELAVVAIAPESGLAHGGAGFGAPSGFSDYTPASAGRLDDGLFGDPLAAPPVAGPGFGQSFGPGFGAGIGPGSGQTARDPFGFDAPPATDFGPAPARMDDPFGFGGPGPAAPFGGAIPDDDDLFGPPPVRDPWPAEAHHDHAPSDQMAFIPPKQNVEAIPDDWDLSDLGVALNPAMVKPQPAMRQAHVEPPPEPAAALRQRHGIPQRAAAPGDGAEAAARALLAAAGLPPESLAPAEAARLMQVAGEMLQATTKGLMEILAARANTKQEFRIERTMIGAARNNPLKMAENPGEALRTLLAAQPPGFIAGSRAIEEALDDIKTHQLAVLAGMQVALTTVVSRFDPARLEKRLEQSSLIESVLPAARKARYWELFKSLYKEIAGELEDDFQKAFGAEFARAYRDQIDRF
jgi:type VI secretion system FHA domain protein